jgi:hypothetical protein
MFTQTANDLCRKYNGVYCDITFSNVDGTWTAFYANQRIKNGFQKRRIAKKWLKQYAASQG